MLFVENSQVSDVAGGSALALLFTSRSDDGFFFYSFAYSSFHTSGDGDDAVRALAITFLLLYLLAEIA